MRKFCSWLFMLTFFAIPILGYAQSDHWEFRGWYGGGCFPNLAFDPNHAQRVYLASDVTGMWRSEDTGESWQFSNQGLGNLMVSQIEISFDSKMMYAATSGGLYFSQDQGNQWVLAENLKGEIRFSRPDNYKSIGISPRNAEDLCVGTANGKVFCSQDHGLHWQNIDPNRQILKTPKPIAVVRWAGDAKTVWIGANDGFYILDIKTATITPIEHSPQHFTDLEMAETTQTLYAAAGGSLWKSLDFGQQWSKLKNAEQGGVYRIGVVALNNPAKITRIYVALNKGWNGEIMVSENDGQTWNRRALKIYPDLDSNPTWRWANPRGKITALKVHPQNPKILFKTDWWGVFRSDDEGISWVEKIKGAPNTVGTDLWINEHAILAATMDNGLLKSSHQGESFEPLFPTKGFDPAVNGHVWRVVEPIPGNIIATSSPWNERINQVILSEDGGKSFKRITQGLPLSRPQKNTMWGEGYPRALAYDPQNPLRLYLGIDGDDGGGLFVSDDGGQHWQRNLGQPDSLRIYRGLAVDPTDSRRIFWGACADQGGVYRSLDQGQTWQRVLKEMMWVFDVVISQDGTIYAVGDKNGPAVFVSNNQGQSWRLLKALPAQGAAVALAIHPLNSQILAVSTTAWSGRAAGKVFLSLDQGRNFRDITGDLPDGTGAAALKFLSQTDELWMSRAAGGVYKLKLNSQSFLKDL